MDYLDNLSLSGEEAPFPEILPRANAHGAVMSTEEIAEELGLTRQGVEGILVRALQKVKEGLARRGIHGHYSSSVDNSMEYPVHLHRDSSDSFLS